MCLQRVYIWCWVSSRRCSDTPCGLRGGVGVTCSTAAVQVCRSPPREVYWLRDGWPLSSRQRSQHCWTGCVCRSQLDVQEHMKVGCVQAQGRPGVQMQGFTKGLKRSCMRCSVCGLDGFVGLLVWVACAGGAQWPAVHAMHVPPLPAAQCSSNMAACLCNWYCDTLILYLMHAAVLLTGAPRLRRAGPAQLQQPLPTTIRA